MTKQERIKQLMNQRTLINEKRFAIAATDTGRPPGRFTPEPLRGRKLRNLASLNNMSRQLGEQLAEIEAELESLQPGIIAKEKRANATCFAALGGAGLGLMFWGMGPAVLLLMAALALAMGGAAYAATATEEAERWD